MVGSDCGMINFLHAVLNLDYDICMEEGLCFVTLC